MTKYKNIYFGQHVIGEIFFLIKEWRSIKKKCTIKKKNLTKDKRTKEVCIIVEFGMITVDACVSSSQNNENSSIPLLTSTRLNRLLKEPDHKNINCSTKNLAQNLETRESNLKNCCIPLLRKSKYLNCCCILRNGLNKMSPSDSPKIDPIITDCQIDRRRVCVNIAGKKYETFESTLAKYPETLLALPQRELFFDSLNGEYFFDRNRKAFGAILTYCQTGVLVKPPNLDDRIFAAELRFFGFEAESEAHLPNVLNHSENTLYPTNSYLKYIWELFEAPDTSLGARLISLFSMSVIVLSIVMFCIETLPDFKKPVYTNDPLTGNSSISSFQTKDEYETAFFAIECACILWFTAEYLLRLISSPKKFLFLRQPLNIIDIVAILPFYITIFLRSTNANVASLSILRVLRLIRVFRIFKLSRYSKGLKILGYTFKASLQELALLVFFLAIGVVLFSSAAYFCEEREQNTQFQSIIHGFWWAIVTMTTVGYGDITPTTLGGKIVGSLCVLVGVLTIAFPVPVIVNNFTYYYTLEQDAPEPLDEDYLETPLGNNRNIYSSFASIVTESNYQIVPSNNDSKQNKTSLRQSLKTESFKANGSTQTKVRSDSCSEIEYHLESPV
ncbi:shaker-related potassium channel tsha2 isoform X2 [Hydra vulgaris]|uniref:shaker-related potassium channel tsha2 isoform X2 n=2 Tax=Hydra vulgaris TaxID=6087 RepID=UPI001F5EEE9A|nr:shaker-related potassium channel tsha2 isoform X1 [Hydra vulgaris]